MKLPLPAALSRRCLWRLAVACLALGGIPSATAAVERVVVVFKTHFDIGYTDMASNVVQRYRTKMIDDALKVVDESRRLPPEQQFAWTLPGWPMAQILADGPGQDPARRARVWQALRDGRFVVHALPFTTHTELLQTEDLVHGLTYASRIARELGVELPRDAKMTDVPSHSWILPTLLRHAGVEFLHLGCNAASRSPQVPRLFWWEGPDGSRLLTMYTAESYGTGLVAPADWPYRTWLALIHTGDNHGPPTPDEVKKLLAEAAEKLPGVQVHIGRLSDFSDALRAEKAEIPVVRGDMPDTWIHGPMSDPQGAALARRVRSDLWTTEILNTHLGAWIGAPSVIPALDAAREQSLLYGEHTWGAGLYWVANYDGPGPLLEYGDAWKRQRAEGRFRRMESSWAEHTRYIETARDQVAPVLKDQLTRLAQAVNVQGRRIVVYNPLPWVRSGYVTVPIKQEAAAGATAAVHPDGTAALHPLEWVSGQMRFWAENIPAGGYQTFVLSQAAFSLPGSGDPANNELVSAQSTVGIDPNTGAIRSWKPNRSAPVPAVDWVDPRSERGLGQHLYERFDRDQIDAYVKAYVKINASWATNELGKPNLPPATVVPRRAVTPTGGTLRYETSPASVSAVWHADASDAVPYGVTTRVTLNRLYAGPAPFVDLELTLHGKPADPWPEAGWICLPLNLPNPQIRLGRLGGLVDPTRDLVPGANHNVFGIDTGVFLADATGAGVGICPLDSPLVSLDQPGCWRYEPEFVPGKPVVYVNVFNNQWTTNFRLWNEGTWTTRVRLWQSDRLSVGPAVEARYPLQAGVAEGPAGTLPTRHLGLETRNAVPSAFRPNPTGPGTLLTLWPLSDLDPARAPDRLRLQSVRLPEGWETPYAQPVDLRGRASGETVTVPGRTLPINAPGPANVHPREWPRLAPGKGEPLSVVLLTGAATNASPAPAALAQRIRSDSRLAEVLARAKALLKTGFNAGSGYREVWIRDFATFIALSCDVVDRAEIRDNLLMFFRLQGDDGNIIDGFVPKQQASVGYKYVKKDTVPDYWGHKNTVETDQESSLVQAVATYVRKTGDRAILDEVVDGRSVRDRLEAALQYVREHRWSERHGLVWGATTVDWGDVQPEHDWGVELDASSHRAIDIYDNAMFLLAIRDFLALVDDPRAAPWRETASRLRRQIAVHLWDAQQQKYFPHVYLEGSPFPPELDERAISYHGGTAVAILAGLLNPAEIRASLEQMRANVRAAKAGSIGLTVYPPYPEGTFKNRGMGPWSYQNGGDWDWFGGRMIQALIANGLVEEAYEELGPMLDRVLKHNGFYEWWDRDNQPKGSATFRGAAGVLGQAIVSLQDWAGKGER